MTKKPFFKTFQIDCGTYEYGINVVITKDIKRAAAFVNSKTSLPTKDLLAANEEDFIALGKIFYRYGYCPVLWLPGIPKTPTEFGTLYHELFHAVCYTMKWANIPLSRDSEEAYCHLIKHLTRKFLEEISKK